MKTNQIELQETCESLSIRLSSSPFAAKSLPQNPTNLLSSQIFKLSYQPSQQLARNLKTAAIAVTLQIIWRKCLHAIWHD